MSPRTALGTDSLALLSLRSQALPSLPSASGIGARHWGGGSRVTLREWGIQHTAPPKACRQITRG